MKEKVNRLAVLTKGIIKENPNLVLLLGTCPTLATTSSAFNGMGMGIGNDLHDLRLLIKLLRYFTAPRSTFQTVR